MTMMALGAGDSPGVNTMALQQGGLGIFLTVLILSVPPMASSFFQGVLGNFMHYSAFGANSAPSKPETPGQGGYRPDTSANPSAQTRMHQNDPRMTQGDRGTPQERSVDKPNARTDIHAGDMTRTTKNGGENTSKS